MTAFQPLEALGLGLTAEDLTAAFQPFVDPAGDQQKWLKQRHDQRESTLRKAFRRAWLGLFGGGSRNISTVSAEYEEVWSAGIARYDVTRGTRKPVPWTYRGKNFMAEMAGVARLRNVILAAAIAKLKPRTVLEVGCGDGINLLLLAGAFPDVSFTGLELTETGNATSKKVQEQQTLPTHLAAYAMAPQKDLTAFRRIDFQRGDASQMPFADGQFDLVYTILSVEQMERIRDKALTEIARVTGGHLLNLEPFAEANEGFWRRAYVWGRHYFAGRISDMPRYGVEPVWATMDIPQEIRLGAALLLSKKR